MSANPKPWGGVQAPSHDSFVALSSWPGREACPPAFGYFLDRARELGAPEALDRARVEGRRVIGVLCTMVPEEWILALNAVPVRLCGGGNGGETSPELPRDVCPVAEAARRQLTAGPLAGRVDAVVAPTTCDWKLRLADRFQASVPVIRLELPRSGDPRVLASALRALAERLAEVTQFSLTAASLRQALGRVAPARAAHRRLEALRREPAPRLPGLQAMLIADTFGYGDLDGWTEACERLVAGLEQPTQAQQSARPRLLLAGAPAIWPNFKLPMLVEQCGGVVVGDDFCSRWSRLVAPDVPPGPLAQMLEGLAHRALEPCTCGTTADPVGRAEAVVAQARDLAADAVVWHYLRGCAPVAAAEATVVQAAREAGLPVLALETDAAEQDVERLRTRIEAFLEMMEPSRE